jgi:hypothetical protein
MNRKNPILTFGAGLVVGLAITVSWLGGASGRRAAAQADDPAPRYQISSWAHPAASNSTGVVDNHRSGAYILDTRGGKVWLVEGQADPRPVGQVR